MQRLRGVRVVVVGGGLAGLVTARLLATQGADVHIVEARDRLGGRVWTLRDSALEPFIAEAGGEFIDGEHKAIRALCRELDLSLVRVLREGFGLALVVNGALRIRRSQSAVWKAFRRALQPLAAALQTVECDWHTTTAAVIGDRSLDALLEAANASDEVRAMAQALRGFFLGDSDRLSALVGVELSLEDSDPGHVPLYRVRGGNDQLALALVRGLDLRISGRHVVNAVTQTPGHVRVAVSGPDGRLDHLHCDYAVVTVPASLLLSCEFTPPLPHDVQDALQALRSGPATKAVFRFASRWWRRDDEPRAFGSNLPVGAVWETAEEQRHSALLTFLGGGSASDSLRQLLALGPARVIECVQWLGRPSRLDAVEQIDWDHDPWARGGYAYFDSRFPPHLRSALARRHGRVFFAGDHTSRDYQGYMNGAVESGQRVAREIELVHAIP